MDERRRKKKDRRSGTERRKGSDKTFQKGLSHKLFADERKGERRRAARRKETPFAMQEPQQEPAAVSLNRPERPFLPEDGLPSHLAYPFAREDEKWFLEDEFKEKRFNIQLELEKLQRENESPSGKGIAQKQTGAQEERKPQDEIARLKEIIKSLELKNSELEKLSAENERKIETNLQERLRKQEEELKKDHEALLKSKNAAIAAEIKKLKEQMGNEVREKEKTFKSSLEKKESEIALACQKEVEGLKRQMEALKSENESLRKEVREKTQEATQSHSAKQYSSEASGARPLGAVTAAKTAEPKKFSKEEYSQYVAKVNKMNLERQKTQQALLYVYSYEEWVYEMNRKS